MSEGPRSNRPTPRTVASVEAELRRRVRAELAQARSDAESGELDDAALAAVIARAVAAALGWHLEAPEHTRNATLSSRTWRPAGGPRAGPRPQDYDDRGPRQYDDRGPRPFEERGPRSFDEPPPPPRQRGPYPRRPPREYDDREPPPPPGPRGRGPRGGFGPPRRGGGFGPRRPRPR